MKAKEDYTRSIGGKSRRGEGGGGEGKRETDTQKSWCDIETARGEKRGRGM